jgi:Flp pilus assembly pilin Flp
VRARLLARQRGISTVEYVVLLVLIAAIAIGAWRLFGETVQKGLGRATDRLKFDDAFGDTSQQAGDGFGEPPPPPSAGTAAPPSTPSSAAAAKAALIHSLVQTKGSATAADAAAVERELSKLPDKALQRLKAYGTKITVVDQSVLQAAPGISTAPPRGWPAGSAWQGVPGVYDNSSKNQVVIVVKNGMIPPTGAGHGSQNLVLHETAHALQAALEQPYLSEGGTLRSPPTAGAKDPAFLNARNNDLGTLTNYQKQPGTAGIDETYAESMASYYENPAAMKVAQPNLYNYWNTHPPGGK